MKMALNIRTVFLCVSASIVFLFSAYHLLIPTASISADRRRFPSFNPQIYVPNPRLRPYVDNNLIIHEQDTVTNSTINVTIRPPYDDDDTGIVQEEGTNSVGFSPDDMIQFKPRIRNSSSEIEGTVLFNNTVTSQVDDVDSILEGSDSENRNNSLRVNSNADSSIMSISILFPSWDVLVIVPSEFGDDGNYTSYFCLYDTNEISPARFSGTLTYPDRKTFMCQLPKRVRRRLPFRQPILTKTPDQNQKNSNPVLPPPSELLRWNFIVYNIIETDNDVVLFAKGINNRQGINRSPTEFKCLFGDNTVNAVTTSVTSSVQEVFRCQRPDLTALSKNPVKASLLILQSNQVVPSIAFYTPRRKLATNSTKSLLCACTMVYNVAKFLQEWVIYHSKIGVDKFILYDNGSTDNLQNTVNFLKSKGFEIEIRFWLWPKTQEAGFSHAALLANATCHWMMYIDIDEFIYSPLWSSSSKPSKLLLPSLLPSLPYGQIMIRCFEFGPSNQKKHPSVGVTQGYTCRKEIENRHKSIVLLDSIHESLLNVIHHFKLKEGFKSTKVHIETVLVNHYKFQAWPEFKAKFRRRVSAYVVDWTRSVNLQSNDRTPGLGCMAVEPEGWADRFCEVYDHRLKDLTRRWFGRRDDRMIFRMDWER